MKIQKIILALMCLIFMASNLDAQKNLLNEDDRAVIVYLNDGTQIEGQIIEWNLGEDITISTAWAPSMTIPASELDKVIQKSTLTKQKQKQKKEAVPYNFIEQGPYYSLRMQLIGGNAGPRASDRVGFGFSASAGFKMNRYFAAGVGIGYDQYIWKSGEDFIPVFIEFSGFALPKNTTPYYNLQLGYAFTSTDDQYLITEASGGIMIYPSVGMRFGTNDFKYMIDLGYKFQQAEFTYEDIWTTQVSAQELTYKRLSLRFGLIF